LEAAPSEASKTLIMAWYAYAIISALAIATVGLLQKKTLQREHSFEYVTIFSLAKLGIFLLVFGASTVWAVSTNDLLLLIVSGVVNGLAFVSITKAMRRMELSTVMPVLSVEPAIVALLAFMTLGERLNMTQVIGLGLTLLGTYILELRRHTDEPHHLAIPFQRLLRDRGGRFALWGLVFFSVASILDRYLLQHVPIFTYMGYMLLSSTMVFVLMWFVSEEKPELFQTGRRWLIPMIILIAILHLGSNLAQAKAVSLAAVGLVIAIKRTAALIDIVVGGRFFHERHLVQKTLASIIILVGVYFIVQP
jgi:drug/metabolite transporter (DMT)-like permease